MSSIDVSQLASETLSAGTFPAGFAADFRVFFTPEVHDSIRSHAKEDTSIEICGVLVGEWQKDDNGPFAVIRNFIRCDSAASKNTEVTFTHESWSQINGEMDSKYADQRIVGWYHSHPDFGIFLSDRDMFIQQHFFSGPGQIAYVVDPVRDLEGVFEWRDNKAELMEHYWVGNRIVSVQASSRPDRPRSLRTDIAAASDAVVHAEDVRFPRESTASFATTLLAALCLFLLGLLLGDWRNNWEQRYLNEGAVAHYGLWNIMQFGRAEQLEKVRTQVSRTFDAVSELAQEQTQLVDAEQRDAVRRKFQSVRKQLADSRDALQLMETRYSVPPDQRELLAQVIAAHLADVSGTKDARRQLPVPVPVGIPAAGGKKQDDAEQAPRHLSPPDEPPGGHVPSGETPADTAADEPADTPDEQPAASVSSSPAGERAKAVENP